MKRTVQMKTGGAPVAGMLAKNFKGWRKSSKHWRAGQPLYVVHPVRRARKIAQGYFANK